MALFREASHKQRATGLAREMEAFEAMPLLDGVKCGIHDRDLEQRVARRVVTGRPVKTEPPQIDRRRFRHLREVVREPHEVVGVAILRAGRVDPIPRLLVKLDVLITLQKDVRSRPFTAGSRDIVANTKVAPIYVEPQRLRVAVHCSRDMVMPRSMSSFLKTSASTLPAVTSAPRSTSVRDARRMTANIGCMRPPEEANPF